MYQIRGIASEKNFLKYLSRALLILQFTSVSFRNHKHKNQNVLHIAYLHTAISKLLIYKSYIMLFCCVCIVCYRILQILSEIIFYISNFPNATVIFSYTLRVLYFVRNMYFFLNLLVLINK